MVNVFEVRDSPFNSESTDVAGFAQLLVYVRYPWEGEIVEDFLFHKPLEIRTTGEEIFKAIDSYMCEHSLKWSDCFGICTDGARSMTGVHKGVIQWVKRVAPTV